MSELNISMEPLFNQSSEGSGASKKIAFVPINTAGAASNRSAVSVTSTAAQITIATGKRTIEFFNSGTKRIYYGGSGVDSTDGIALFPNQVKVYANVKDDFSLYFVTASGDSSTLRIVEYT